MRKLIFIVFCVLHKMLVASSCMNTGDSIVVSYDSLYWDIYADTWVATDALGRTMPSFEEVGNVKKDKRRVVGIFT